MVSKSGDGDPHNFIRWSVPLDGSIQEESVEVLSEESTEATIRALSGLLEKTPVYIKANTYTGNGIVESCIPEGQGHRVVIQLVCKQMITIHTPHNVDPGVFAADGFLTEEEESKILEALGDGTDYEDPPEESAGKSGNSILRSLKEALSPQANALAAVTALESSATTIIQ